MSFPILVYVDLGNLKVRCLAHGAPQALVRSPVAIRMAALHLSPAIQCTPIARAAAPQPATCGRRPRLLCAHGWHVARWMLRAIAH
jgi:hypothetical protein